MGKPSAAMVEAMERLGLAEPPSDGCVICLGTPDEDGEWTRWVNIGCGNGHVMHFHCRGAWTKDCRAKGEPATCPMCREPVADEMTST